MGQSHIVVVRIGGKDESVVIGGMHRIDRCTVEEVGKNKIYDRKRLFNS